MTTHLRGNSVGMLMNTGFYRGGWCHWQWKGNQSLAIRSLISRVSGSSCWALYAISSTSQSNGIIVDFTSHVSVGRHRKLGSRAGILPPRYTCIPGRDSGISRIGCGPVILAHCGLRTRYKPLPRKCFGARIVG